MEELLRKARERYDRMTPAEREAMWRAQKASFARAELVFGSDADEAEYRHRMELGLPLHDTPSGRP